ncbi:hypothetical protein B9Z19DRAFT_685097 [Tuber borchii]|uniref:Uncharacterized protein n=1 Tax=Tuber borchii TaxID=42251 RepID=A0A2T6ZA53_TUBBO|nr:hypothetical protein B9Z19DRAFT_685097 [Tuber borchii]
MSFFRRSPNYPRENNNAFNTTGSSNHNANAQNHNSDAFNTTNYSYGIYFVNYTLNYTLNYTPNETEMARRIPGTLSPPLLAAPPNPDSTLREATVHQHQGWLQVTDGIQSPNMGMQATPPMSHYAFYVFPCKTTYTLHYSSPNGRSGKRNHNRCNGTRK